jgi:hypothetical protein
MPNICFSYPADVPPSLREPRKMPIGSCFSYSGDMPRAMPITSCFSYSVNASPGEKESQHSAAISPRSTQNAGRQLFPLLTGRV